MPTIWQTVGKLIVKIFGLQPDGTLAGGGVIRSLVFNILLFIPCGYLTALWLLQLVQIRSEKRDKQGRDRRRGRIVAVAICTVVSILIELLQSLTGLGMADIKDVIGD